MRIWMINHYAVPLGAKNASRHAVLAKYLRQSGHEITIFAASLAHGTDVSSNLSEFAPGEKYLDECRDGTQWRFIRTKPYRNNFQRLRLMYDFHVKVVQSAIDLPKPDVVIGSCVHPYAVEAARKIGRQLTVPFIYEIRDIWPESLVDVGGMSPWHPAYQLFRRMEHKAFRSADGVLSLLPGMRSYAENHGIVADRICYLPNGIDPEAYPLLTKPSNGHEFLCSYFGAHGPANNLTNILEAASILQKNHQNHIRIQFVGDGSSKQSLVEHSKALGLNNVSFHAPVVKNELIKFAERTDAFLFNLKKMPIIEKYGLSSNKLFEYLVHARPIVFACSSFNNPVEESGAGISIPPEDPQTMANAITHLSQTGVETRHRMGIQGREFALQNHDLAKLAERLAGFLAETIKRHKAASLRCVA